MERVVSHQPGAGSRAAVGVPGRLPGWRRAGRFRVGVCLRRGPGVRPTACSRLTCGATPRLKPSRGWRGPASGSTSTRRRGSTPPWRISRMRSTGCSRRGRRCVTCSTSDATRTERLATRRLGRRLPCRPSRGLRTDWGCGPCRTKTGTLQPLRGVPSHQHRSLTDPANMARRRSEAAVSASRDLATRAELWSQRGSSPADARRRRRRGSRGLPEGGVRARGRRLR
jgi:hypothetical protein